MNRVLLTGGTGFIGRHALAGLTARGYEVHATTSRDARVSGDGVTWHRTDLLDPEQVARLLDFVRPTHLLHLAWYAVPGDYVTSPANLSWVQASLALLDHFARTGGRRVVMAGSSFEYDWNYGFCSERITPTTPVTVYGRCKHALSELLAASAGASDLSASWGRIFFLYGPHEDSRRLVASVIRSLLNDQVARCSHGEQIRDYLHVEDVAGALVALLDCDVTGPVNIASGRPVVLKDLIRTIGRKLEREDLIALGALPARADESPIVVADIRRLATEVGWKPSFDLDLGLERTIECYKGEVSHQTFAEA